MTKPRILVVDDETKMLHTVQRLLDGSYEVATAESSREALALAPEFGPELAILDVRMPEMDGFELMAHLRETIPGVDVLFITGAVHELDAHMLRSIRERAFYFVQKPFDREVFLTLVERCLEQRRLARENREHVKRLESELAAARSFQQSLLPPASQRFGPITLAGSYRPCDELGGDFYDYVKAANERVAFLIADVSGHGVAAAMLTGIVKSCFHDARADDFEPATVSRRIADAIRTFDDARFVTVFCGHLSHKEEQLEYVNAGHPPALHMSAKQGPSSLGITCPMISPAFEIDHETARIKFARGDHLLLYTDGIVEARGDGGFFGEERLHALATGSGSGDLLQRISNAVRSFAAGRPADDDETMLVVALE